MGKYWLILLAFLANAGMALAVESPRMATFYRGGYDYTIRDKEAYLKKISDPRLMNISRDQILASATKAFDRVFSSMDEYKAFIRSDEVTVRPATFKNSPVEFLSKEDRIETIARDARSNELALHYQGGDRISLSCGQGVADERRTVPKPMPEPVMSQLLPPPLAPPMPQIPSRIIVAEEIRVMESKDECQEYGVVTTIIPSYGLNMGVYGRSFFAGISGSKLIYQQAMCVK